MCTIERSIRKAVLPADGEQIMAVFLAAKGIMRASGNMHQWGEGYPSLDDVRADIERDGAYVVEDDGQIVAYFAFLPSPNLLMLRYMTVNGLTIPASIMWSIALQVRPMLMVCSRALWILALSKRAISALTLTGITTSCSMLS